MEGDVITSIKKLFAFYLIFIELKHNTDCIIIDNELAVLPTSILKYLKCIIFVSNHK